MLRSGVRAQKQQTQLGSGSVTKNLGCGRGQEEKKERNSEPRKESSCKTTLASYVNDVYVWPSVRYSLSSTSAYSTDFSALFLHYLIVLSLLRVHRFAVRLEAKGSLGEQWNFPLNTVYLPCSTASIFFPCFSSYLSVNCLAEREKQAVKKADLFLCDSIRDSFALSSKSTASCLTIYNYLNLQLLQLFSQRLWSGKTDLHRIPEKPTIRQNPRTIMYYQSN